MQQVTKPFKLIKYKNRLCEKSEVKIEYAYADVMRGMYLAFTFAAILPTGIVINSIGMILYYWAEKVLFFY